MAKDPSVASEFWHSALTDKFCGNKNVIEIKQEFLTIFIRMQHGFDS
jgi:hypothetical protein